MPYHLHAIIIHDGSADMGHYYTFIFDRFKKVWWKINDNMVREEAEEVVMEEAKGGFGYRSASHLFYIKQEIVDMMEHRQVPLF